MKYLYALLVLRVSMVPVLEPETPDYKLPRSLYLTNQCQTVLSYFLYHKLSLYTEETPRGLAFNDYPVNAILTIALFLYDAKFMGQFYFTSVDYHAPIESVTLQ